jgi:hypothetical protein
VNNHAAHIRSINDRRASVKSHYFTGGADNSTVELYSTLTGDTILSMRIVDDSELATVSIGCVLIKKHRFLFRKISVIDLKLYARSLTNKYNIFIFYF